VDEDWELRALALGAADFITKPLRPAVLLARIRNLVRERRLTTELRRLAQADGLTGLANRRQFDEVLRSELVRGRRQRAPLCLLMLDVDHFKAYNDRLGHLAGDQALCRVAAVLQQACQRAGDLACRYGGEEFALILPATDEQGGQHVAEAVRAAVQALALPHPGSPLGRVSVSLGVAVERSQGAFRPPADSQFGSLASGAMLSLVERADAALYRAKHLGRDQVVVARPEADQPAPTGWQA
jgi:diguanylate cyclase (GGDEF)-like protein